jgi:hypothetical protein
MADDPVLALERELVGAAERQALRAAAAVADPRSDIDPRRGTGARRGTGTRWRWRPRLGVLAATSFALIPVLVVLGVVIAIRGNRSATPALVLQKPVPTLVSELGVLRGPQTRAAVAPKELRLIAPVTRRAGVTVQRPLLRARLVPLTGPGQTHVSRVVELIVGEGTDGQQMLGVHAVPWAATGPDAASTRIAQGGEFVTAQALSRHGLFAVLGADGPADTDAVVVVPDGVRSVELRVPGLSAMFSPVAGNLAGFRIAGQRLVAIEARASMVWYGSGNRVIRRVPAALPSRIPITPPLSRLFGVLRRPAGPGEKPSRGALAALQTSAVIHGGTLDRTLLRSVSVRLWPTTRRTMVDLVTVLSRAAGHPQELAVSDYPLRGFAAGRVPPPTYFGTPEPLETLLTQGLTAPLRTDTATGSDVVVVVPEEIVRVVFTAPGQRPVSARVSDNVAGFHVPGRRFALMPIGATMTWYGAQGQVLHRVSGA